MVERSLSMREVPGSIPGFSKFFFLFFFLVNHPKRFFFSASNLSVMVSSPGHYISDVRVSL